ncbi:MFS transporter [Gracilibacillus kekensis]|uniref:MFS transporter, YQGE family, putative transporter n=1 Tax=Gracilibacillus kekensis TaxID=1027249 RepID=A0A1M7P4Z6_9BACI|nr:MFS transporter [Gracilibacillus kekensis]SHN11669.1 MFS transporter, YQGE family, putative transporter [Gracilibacillus kekensis]
MSRFGKKNKPMIPNRKDLKLLLTIGGLYALATFLSNTFVNIYLWKQSGEYIDIASYNLFIYIFQPIAFVIAGKFAKKVDRTIIIRVGVTFLSVFYVTVLLAGDQASQFPYLLGAILGIGYGFYWLAFNVLTFEVTEPESRDFFNGILGTLQSFGGMVGPFFAGYIITRLDNFQGYSIIFFISFFLFLVAIICSFFLKKRKATGKFLFKKVALERKIDQNWRNILYAHIFQGLREGLFIFIIAIWVFIATNSEFALGAFNLTMSLCSFIGYFVVSKVVKIEHRKRAILIGGLLLYAGVVIFVFQTSYWMLLAYGILIGFAYPIFNVPFISLTYDIIGKAKGARELRIEYIIFRELFINIGRITSILIFIFTVTLVEPVIIIPVLLLTIGGGNLFAYYFVRKTNMLMHLTNK